MKYTCKFLLTITALSVLVSCKSVQVEKPLEAYDNQVFSSRNSVVSFTTQTRIIDIQNELNRSFTGLIYEDNSLENNGGDNVMVKAWKQGDIQLNMNGNVLKYRVPLKTWIKAGFNIQKFGIAIADYRELNASLALKFNTALTLNSDWSVTTKTTSDGYEWLSTPTIKVGGMDISVKFVADLIMQAGLKKMGSTIDASIKDYLDLKPYARNAWDMINKPLKINDEYNVWLKIDPQKIVSSTLTANNGMIKHQAGLNGTINLSLGEVPSNPGASKPLPDLLIGEMPVEVTTLNANVSMPYTEINKVALSYLKGKSFEQGKRKVVVEDLRIYGSGGNLVAETLLSGSFKGAIYFIGKPVYNPIDSTLVIKDFDYELSTKNFLIKSASWLYQDGFRRLIADQLKWSISKEMIMIRSTVNNKLKSYKLTPGITLTGTIDRVEPGQVFITPEGLVPEIMARGKFAITIEKLPIAN